MVSQVGSVSMPNYGLNPLNNLNPNAALNNTTNTNSLLNFGTNTNPLMPNGNNYEDDLFMPPELKTTGAQTNIPVQNTSPQISQLPAQNEPPQQLPTENVQPQVQNNPQGDLSQELNGTLARPDGNIELTDNGNPYNKTGFWKKTGAALGFLAPLTGKFVQLFKGGKLTKVFNLKQLVTVCPMIAIAGYGIGSLLDGCINSNRAKRADETARQFAQAQQSQPINMVA